MQARQSVMLAYHGILLGILSGILLIDQLPR